MPQPYLALPPTGLRIVGGSRLVNGLEFGLTVEDRAAIGALASEQLIQEWARQAVALAPRRSGRLARSIRPRAHRGLEVPFYGPFQQVGNLPWANTILDAGAQKYTYCRALGRTQASARFQFSGCSRQSL